MLLRDLIYSKMEEYGYSKDLEMNMDIEKRLNITKKRIIYTCDGYPLPIACKRAGVSNSEALKVFHEEYQEPERMTKEEIDDAFKEIVGLLKNKPKKAKKLVLNI